MKKVRAFLIFILCAVFLTAAVFLFRYATRVRLNEGYVSGNTAGNLYNTGYFCEQNGIVYFANPSDRYCLYSMDPDGTNLKKLADQSVSYLNSDDHYLYYCKIQGESDSSFSFLPINTNSLCRLPLNGRGGSVILDDAPCMYASLCGNYIYYLHYDTTEATTLYKVKIDGSQKQQIDKNPLFTASVEGPYIYYNGVANDHNIYEFDTVTDSSSVLFEGNCWMPVKNGDELYFLDCENNYRLTKVTLSTGKKTVLCDDRIECYNVYGDFIFFQRNDKENPALCVMNTDGSNYRELKSGNFTAINATSAYVYFKDFSHDVFFRTSSVSPGAVEQFTP